MNMSMPKENQIGSKMALYGTNVHTCPPFYFPSFYHLNLCTLYLYINLYIHSYILYKG